MHLYRRLFLCLDTLLLALCFTLATGCGSVSSNSNPTPTPTPIATPTPGNTPSPTPVPTPSPSPTPSPVPGPSNAAQAAHDPGTAPGAPGSFYAPALLVPGGGPFLPGDAILPGTDVGTIQLRFTSQGDIEGSVTSTDSTQKVPIPIHVKFAPMRIFTLDFVFDYPWVGSAPQLTTAPGPSCATGTSCASFQLSPVPTDRVE
jgi:hypothetical protein